MADYDADPIWSSSRTARQIHDLGRVEKVGPLALVVLTITYITTHATQTQDIGHLLSLASTSLALLSLPQTDAPDETLPEGDERSEQFVAKVGEYFETLDVRLLLLHRFFFTLHIPSHTSLTKSTILQGIQMALRSSLAHIRATRISPAVLTAPPAGFVPPPQGVGLPFPLPPSASDHGSSGTGAEAEGSHPQAKEKTRGLLEERVERDAWRGALDALTRLMDARRAAEAEAEAQPMEN
jgi:hypothetical protein